MEFTRGEFQLGWNDRNRHPRFTGAFLPPSNLCADFWDQEARTEAAHAKWTYRQTAPAARFTDAEGCSEAMVMVLTSQQNPD